MYLLLIAIVSFSGSLLTFFSGFGLGTLLSPLFVLFFPVQVAIAGTAVVHFCNNLFKLLLMYRYIRWDIFLKFSIPAGIAAIFGALLLTSLGRLDEFFNYSVFGEQMSVQPMKLIVGFLFIFFAIAELSGNLKNRRIDKKYIHIGGFISGFFGGLTGNQGAFRTAFLVNFGLTKEAFVATGIVSSCVVDFFRISVYWLTYNQYATELPADFQLAISIAIIFAFSGAFIGRKLLTKISMTSIRYTIAVFMILVGTGLAGGII